MPTVSKFIRFDSRSVHFQHSHRDTHTQPLHPHASSKELIKEIPQHELKLGEQLGGSFDGWQWMVQGIVDGVPPKGRCGWCQLPQPCFFRIEKAHEGTKSIQLLDAIRGRGAPSILAMAMFGPCCLTPEVLHAFHYELGTTFQFSLDRRAGGLVAVLSELCQRYVAIPEVSYKENANMEPKDT